MSKLDDIFDKHYPLGKVVAKDNIDETNADIMTKIMKYQRDKFIAEIKDLMHELITECDRHSGFDDDVFMIEESELRKKVEEL